jgi:hypothetical protein
MRIAEQASQQARALLLLLGLGVMSVPEIMAVQPEAGLYVPGTTSSGDPAKFVYIEVQEEAVLLTLIAFDPDTGLPELYQGLGQLRDDAINPGQTDAPLLTTGYYPLHAFVGDLVKIDDGRCLTCGNSPTTWRRVVVGRVEAYFPNTGTALVEVRLFPEHRPPGLPGNQVIPLQRVHHGRQRVLLGNSNPLGPPAFVVQDLRGQWVFVDQADAGAPVRDEVVRYEFTEQVLSPQPFIGPSYTVTYRDPIRQAELRCTSVGTAIGQKAAGCELHSQGRVLFSARARGHRHGPDPGLPRRAADHRRADPDRHRSLPQAGPGDRPAGEHAATGSARAFGGAIAQWCDA